MSTVANAQCSVETANIQSPDEAELPPLSHSDDELDDDTEIADAQVDLKIIFPPIDNICFREESELPTWPNTLGSTRACGCPADLPSYFSLPSACSRADIDLSPTPRCCVENHRPLGTTRTCTQERSQTSHHLRERFTSIILRECCGKVDSSCICAELSVTPAPLLPLFLRCIWEREFVTESASCIYLISLSRGPTVNRSGAVWSFLGDGSPLSVEHISRYEMPTLVSTEIAVGSSSTSKLTLPALLPTHANLLAWHSETNSATPKSTLCPQGFPRICGRRVDNVGNVFYKAQGERGWEFEWLPIAQIEVIPGGSSARCNFDQTYCFQARAQRYKRNTKVWFSSAPQVANSSHNQLTNSNNNTSANLRVRFCAAACSELYLEDTKAPVAPLDVCPLLDDIKVNNCCDRCSLPSSHVSLPNTKLQSHVINLFSRQNGRTRSLSDYPDVELLEPVTGERRAVSFASFSATFTELEDGVIAPIFFSAKVHRVSKGPQMQVHGPFGHFYRPNQCLRCDSRDGARLFAHFFLCTSTGPRMGG